MRNLIFILVAAMTLIFTGCEKDEPDVAKTTYQVFNNREKSNSTVEYLDGSLYEVVVYCYIGSDIVRQDNYDKITPGEKSPIKEVPDNFEKIKVSFKMLPKESDLYDSSGNDRLYTVSYTLLDKHINNVSEINSETMVGKSNK